MSAVVVFLGTRFAVVTAAWWWTRTRTPRFARSALDWVYFALLFLIVLLAFLSGVQPESHDSQSSQRPSAQALRALAKVAASARARSYVASSRADAPSPKTQTDLVRWAAVVWGLPAPKGSGPDAAVDLAQYVESDETSLSTPRAAQLRYAAAGDWRPLANALR